MLPNTKCGLWFSVRLLSETFCVLRRVERDFNETSNFSTDLLRKSTKIPNFVKIRTMKFSCSMRTDGQMERERDMTKLIVAFRNLAKAPNKSVRHA